MIAEHCKSKNGKQTRHAKAVAIGDYITNPQGKDHAEKCTAIATFNLSAAVYNGKDYNSHAAAREMCATAGTFYPEGGKNSVDPIAHWSLSFQEKLSDQQLIDLGKEFLKEMRVDPERHQVVMGVHRDTKHGHVHILVNKVGIDGTYSTMGFSNGDRLYKLHSQKVVAEMSHRHGFAQLEKNRFAVDENGKAVKKPMRQASIHDNEVSPDSAKIEAHQGISSHERRLKIALAAALPSLKKGMGYTAVQAELAKVGIEMKKRKSGIVYSLNGEKPIKASLLGKEVTREGLKPFFDADLSPATRETAVTIISGIKNGLDSDADWPLFHSQLAEHGITAIRDGKTSRAGGELVYTLESGETMRGNEIGASLLEIESALGTTYRKAKKLRKTNPRAENLALVDIDKTEAPKAELIKVTDKDTAAEDVKKLYEQGRALSDENKKKIDDYFRDSRRAKELAKQIRAQGWNPAKNAMLQQLRQSSKGAKTAEAAAMMAIATILKMIPVFLSDLSSFGSAASAAIERFKSDSQELREHAETLKKREDKIKMISPEKAERIYKAHRESLVDIWSRQKNDAGKSDVLISAGIADRLRATGHCQSEIVAILQAGGEESSMAELSGYYAYSEKGDKTYEKHKQYISVWAKLEKDACKSDEQKQRNAQNSRNNGQQTRNTVQNKQTRNNNNMKM